MMRADSPRKVKKVKGDRNFSPVDIVLLPFMIISEKTSRK